VDPTKAKVLYAGQQPLAASAFDTVMTVPAWKLIPSWYLVAQHDEALPPDAERMFATRMNATTIEVPSGHLAMVSHPAEVAKLTQTAAEAALAAIRLSLQQTPASPVGLGLPGHAGRSRCSCGPSDCLGDECDRP
jgi:hypothetical protein